MPKIAGEQQEKQVNTLEAAKVIISHHPYVHTLDISDNKIALGNESVTIPSDSIPFHINSVKALGTINHEYTQEFEGRPKAISLSEGPREVLDIRPIVNAAPRRGGSRHEVTFAFVTYIDRFGKTDTGVMALKFHTSLADALSELMNGAQVRLRGIQTIEQQFLLAGKEKVILMSPLCKTIGLDTLRYGRYEMTEKKDLKSPFGEFGLIYHSSPDAINETDFISYIQKVTSLIAYQHTRKVFHRDAKLKNFALNPENQCIPFDWEAAHIFMGDIPDEKFVELVASDLHELFKSLKRNSEISGIGVITDNLPLYLQESLFRKLIYDTYTTSYQDMVADTTSVDQFVRTIDQVYRRCKSLLKSSENFP